MPHKNTTASCSRSVLSEFIFSSLKLQMMPTELCEEKHNGLLLGFVLEINRNGEYAKRNNLELAELSTLRKSHFQESLSFRAWLSSHAAIHRTSVIKGKHSCSACTQESAADCCPHKAPRE